MDLLNMDDLDLTGILFVEFPAEVSLADSRERLEAMIELAGLEYPDETMPDFDVLPDGTPRLNGRAFSISTPVLSPFWIYEAFKQPMRKAVNALPQERFDDLAAQAWADRAERRAKLAEAT